MKEYIEREAAREYFHLGVDCNDCEQDARRCQYFGEITRMDICSAIDDIPAADVVEVRHGRWIDSEEDGHLSICGVCNYPVDRFYKTKYCPNCGARMDGGADDAAD